MAKFKVGDVVSVKREAAEMIDNPALARKRGRVTKVLPGGYYEVDGELGATGLELSDAELTLANSRAANAKFKVGDRVIIKEWARQKTAGYGRGTIIKKVGAQFLVRPDEQSHAKYYVPTYAWNEDDLVAANARACNGVRSRNAVVAKALNACARNYAYSTDVIKLLAQYAKKEDYGGIMDMTRPEDAEDIGLYPAELVRRIYAKASKYYAGGRNMATPAQTQELVGLISQLKYKSANACGAARNAMDDAEAQRLWDDFQKKLAAVKRDADTLRAKFRADKHWAYAEQMGFVIQKLDDAVFK